MMELALSYLLESNQSLYFSEVNPIYNVADILVYSQSFSHQMLASESGIYSIIVKSKNLFSLVS